MIKRLFGEVTLEGTRDLLRQFGVENPEGYNESPDGNTFSLRNSDFDLTCIINGFNNGLEVIYLEGRSEHEFCLTKELDVVEPLVAVTGGSNISYYVGTSSDFDGQSLPNNKFMVHNGCFGFSILTPAKQDFQLYIIRINRLMKQTIELGFGDQLKDLLSTNETVFYDQVLSADMVNVLHGIKEQQTINPLNQLFYEYYVSTKAAEFFLLALNNMLSSKKRFIKGDMSEREVHWAFALRSTIIDNLEKSLTIHDLSAMVGVNETYAKSVFKRFFGETLHQFYRNKKLEWAHSLLVDTDLSIAEIADRVGFINVGHFCRNFKNKYNDTPKRFQLKVKQDRRIDNNLD